MGRRVGRVIALCGITLLIIGCSTDQEPSKALQAPTTTSGEPTPGAPGAGDPYYPKDGNGGYDALDYQVSIGYDPANGHLDGETTVTAKATKALSRFNLDLRGLEVSSVTVNGAAAETTREGEFELVITPAEPLPAGETFRTTVAYSGQPSGSSGGAFGSSGWQRADSGASYVLGEPHSAAYWYPVNGTPRDKATFNLTARVPDGWTAVSIGLENGHSSEEGWTTWRWEEPNPVASYLTTVAIGKFGIERAELPGGTPVLSAYAPGAGDQRNVGSRVPEVIEFLASRFGDYPQSAAGGIYLDKYVGFSLETQGRPTYTSGVGIGTVVHELAHQWFGNTVSIRSWADICLNECLASYAQWLWMEAQQGTDLDSYYRQAVEQLGDDEFWSHKLHDMGAGNEFAGVYDKGALAIHALRRQIGDEAFNTVLREWPARHHQGNASWPEFERFVAETSGQDLTGFFDAWFRGTTIPAQQYLYPGSLAN